MPVTYAEVLEERAKRKEQEYYGVRVSLDAAITNTYRPQCIAVISFKTSAWDDWKERIVVDYPEWCFAPLPSLDDDDGAIWVAVQPRAERLASVMVDTDTTISVQSTISEPYDVDGGK